MSLHSEMLIRWRVTKRRVRRKLLAAKQALPDSLQKAVVFATAFVGYIAAWMLLFYAFALACSYSIICGFGVLFIFGMLVYYTWMWIPHAGSVEPA